MMIWHYLINSVAMNGVCKNTGLPEYAIVGGICKRHMSNGYRYGRLNPRKGEDVCDTTV